MSSVRRGVRLGGNNASFDRRPAYGMYLHPSTHAPAMMPAVILLSLMVALVATDSAKPGRDDNLSE